MIFSYTKLSLIYIEVLASNEHFLFFASATIQHSAITNSQKHRILFIASYSKKLLKK